MWLRRVLFLFFIVPLFPGSVFSMEDIPAEAAERVDGLYQQIARDDLTNEQRMEALLDLGWAIRSSRPSEALQLSKRGLAIAECLERPQDVIRALTDIGLIYWRMGNFSMAYDFFFEARQMAEREGDRFGFARVLSSIGIIFSGQGHYDNALEYYFRALQIYDDIDSIARTASVLNNIGMVYQRRSEFSMAEIYHRESLSVKEAFGDLKGLAFSLNNLGVVAQENGSYDEALDYFSRALSIREGFQDHREMANTRRNMGVLFFRIENFERAIEELSLSRVLFEGVEDYNGVAQVDFYLGEVYHAQGEIRRAFDLFYQSLEVSERLGLAALASQNYKKLSELMALRGWYRDAYRLQQEYLIIQDSIHDEDTRRRVIELQLMYDRERKEDEIELLRKANQITVLNLEKQRLLRNFLVSFVILILIMLFILYNRFLVTNKTNKLLEIQKEEIHQNNRQLQDLNSKLVEEKGKVEELNTKLQESEKNLMDINKTKDKFFSIISHDLRNPFASIVSFSRILKRDINQLSRDELRELTLELDKSVLKISSLLDNLLQWSRSQTKKIKFQPEYFQPKEIIRDNINLFSAVSREKNIDVIDRVDETLTVYGDVNMTETVVRNLLSNALKYTNMGGEIVLSSEVVDDFARLKVADSGVGIAAIDQKKLFRVDTLHTTYGTRDEKGSGLGLLLCREFVEKQGGWIDLKSVPDEGSVFSFSLPLKGPEA